MRAFRRQHPSGRQDKDTPGEPPTVRIVQPSKISRKKKNVVERPSVCIDVCNFLSHFFFFTEKRGFSFSSFLSRSSESTMYRTFLTPPESKSPVFLRFVKLPPRAAAANTAVASSPPPAAGVRPPALGLWLTSLQGAAHPGLEYFRVGAFSETPHTTSYESFGPFSCVPTSSFLDTDDNSGAASRWQDCRFMSDSWQNEASEGCTWLF